MKYLYIIFLIMVMIFCTGTFYDHDNFLNISYQPNTDRLESIFRSALPLKEGIVYTKVPRGLIVSIDENYFFSNGEARIKESSLCILNTIILLLHKLPNYCVVEDHTENNNLSSSIYSNDCELSVARSANIVQYMITYGKLSPLQLFSLGFGQYMPFRGNVEAYDKGYPTGMAVPGNFQNNNKKMNKRIDFVIIEYEARR